MKTGLIIPCVIMVLFIPIMSGCYSISNTIKKQPEKLVIINKSNLTEPQLTILINWSWLDNRDLQFVTPVEFDVLGTVNLIDWTLLDRTVLSNSIVPRLDYQFFRVGVHNK